LTDPAAPEVRPTRDVDVITEVGSLAEYYRLADALRVAGFVEDQGLGAAFEASYHHVVESVWGIEAGLAGHGISERSIYGVPGGRVPYYITALNGCRKNPT